MPDVQFNQLAELSTVGIDDWESIHMPLDTTVTSPATRRMTFANVADHTAKRIVIPCNRYAADFTQEVQNRFAEAASAVVSEGRGAEVEFPQGVFTIEDEITGTQNYVCGRGVGGNQGATILRYSPAADHTTMFTFDKGSLNFGTGLRDMWLLKDTGVDRPMTGVRFNDVTQGFLHNMIISDFKDSTQNSCCVRTAGREWFHGNRLRLVGDTCLNIKNNPAAPPNSADHYIFDGYQHWNTTTVSPVNHVVMIDSDVLVGTMFFYGVACGPCKGFLKWSPSTAGASIQMLIQGLRTEQGTDANAYAIDIDGSTQTLRSLIVRDSKLDLATNGFRLGSVRNAFLSNITHVPGSEKVFIHHRGGGGGREIQWHLCDTSGVNSRLRISGLRNISNSANIGTNDPVPPNGHYALYSYSSAAQVAPTRGGGTVFEFSGLLAEQEIFTIPLQMNWESCELKIRYQPRTAGTIKETPTNVAIVAGSPATITRAAGSWVSLGVNVGDHVVITNAEDPENNKLVIADAVTATEIQVSETMTTNADDDTATFVAMNPSILHYSYLRCIIQKGVAISDGSPPVELEKSNASHFTYTAGTGAALNVLFDGTTLFVRPRTGRAGYINIEARADRTVV